MGQRPTLDLSELTNPRGSRAWRNDWWSNPYWAQWTGFTGDLSWAIEHVFGFLGRVYPLAVHSQHDTFLIKAGGRHFLFKPNQFNLWTFDINASPLDILRGEDEDDFANPHHGSELVDHYSYDAFFQTDDFLEQVCKEQESSGRNRWVEQKARGGRPHERLLKRVERL